MHATVLLLASLAVILQAVAQADEFDSAGELLSPGSGALLLHHEHGSRNALQLEACMQLRIEGLLGSMRLQQTFRNTSDEWLDGSYLFPLPEDAAVQGLQIRIGDRLIVGQIQPRAQARATFEQAALAGQIASVMNQQRPDLFTLDVANIAPQSDISITLDATLPVALQDGESSLTLPTTLTPRYINRDASQASRLDRPFVAAGHADGPVLDIELTIAPLQSVDDISSNVEFVSVDDRTVHVRSMPMNRDLEFRWPMPVPAQTEAVAFVAEHEGKRYAQVLMMPPASDETGIATARELIFVVDKSGSMAGVSLRAAIRALNLAIDQLSPTDRVNIVAFDDDWNSLFPHARNASPAVRQQARDFIDGLQADGGTQMEQALEFALQGQQSSRFAYPDSLASTESSEQLDRLRQVVFITDGSVANEDRLLRRIQQNIGDNRLFTVGIGPAPNHWFLQRAAQAGRALALTIRSEHEVGHAIDNLLNALRFPVLTDIAVHLPEGQAEMYPQPIPDLYADRPAMWVSRIDSDVKSLIITGSHGGKAFRQSVMLPDASDSESRTLHSGAPALAMHWARQKIRSLEDEQRLSGNPERHRQAITQLALETGLMTRYTSFVAVDQTPTRPEDSVSRHEDLPNRIPQGNRMMRIALPRTAAGMDSLLWLAFMLAASASLLLIAARRRN